MGCQVIRVCTVSALCCCYCCCCSWNFSMIPKTASIFIRGCFLFIFFKYNSPCTMDFVEKQNNNILATQQKSSRSLIFFLFVYQRIQQIFFLQCCKKKKFVRHIHFDWNNNQVLIINESIWSHKFWFDVEIYLNYSWRWYFTSLMLKKPHQNLDKIVVFFVCLPSAKNSSAFKFKHAQMGIVAVGVAILL